MKLKISTMCQQGEGYVSIELGEDSICINRASQFLFSPLNRFFLKHGMIAFCQLLRYVVSGCQFSAFKYWRATA